MAEVSKRQLEHEPGCGIIGGIFRSKNLWLRKTISLPSIPAKKRNVVDQTLAVQQNQKMNATGMLKTGRSSSVDSAVLQSLAKPRRTAPVSMAAVASRTSDAARTSSSSSSSSSQTTCGSNDRKLQTCATDLSKLSDEKALVLLNSVPTIKSMSPKPMTKASLGGVSIMGNIVRQQPSNELKRYQETVNRSDPVALTNMGNDAFKSGRSEEALRLYQKAISLDPRKAIYWCNKSAALACLGRFIEAFVECKEAVRLDPNYQRAHHCLATICHRLGEAPQAIYHYNQAGLYSNPKEISQAQALAEHINGSDNARKLNNWNLLLKETQSAVNSGADAAPMVYALQAEALLKLQRHQEAYKALQKAPNFAIKSCINFFGLNATAYLLMIKAETHLVCGRFEDATSAAQHAARLDPGNKEVASVVRKCRLVSSARFSGNLLFKASKFSEACVVYTEGLQHDPQNSVMLCNRAACQSKLGRFEKAIDDCVDALNVQPSYSKARLRRADCYAKLQKWEAAILDYETVIKETSGDVEVSRALFEAKRQLMNQRGEEVKDM